MRLRVSLHGVVAGFLERREGGLITFRFDSRYLEMAERPVLGRWYEDHLEPEFFEKSSQGMVPPYFQNYLPEPNSALRELLARRANVPANRELALLAVLGEDLPGAAVVDLVGDDDGDEPVDALREHQDPQPGGPLRFSLAGMQLKFSVAQSAAKLTLPVTGVGGRFILKMPAREYEDVPANEFSVMSWARESGLSVPDVSLVRWREVEGLPPELDFREEDALLVSRFDRSTEGGARVHQEDFAQVLGKRPYDKYGREAEVRYDRIGKIVAELCGEDDFFEFLRRLVFVVLCNNPDAHLKNWSLIYPDGRRPRLAPAYDLVSTAGYTGISTELAHRLAGEWQIERVGASHFGVLASRAGFDAHRGVEVAGDFAQRARDAWKRLSSHWPLPSAHRDAVEKHLARIKLP